MVQLVKAVREIDEQRQSEGLSSGEQPASRERKVRIGDYDVTVKT